MKHMCFVNFVVFAVPSLLEYTSEFTHFLRIRSDKFCIQSAHLHIYYANARYAFDHQYHM